MSASSGTNVAEQPNNPISTPYARANCHRLTAKPGGDIAQRQRHRAADHRQDDADAVRHRPISTPPNAKPIMVSVNGSDAALRSTSNSACTAGSATTTDHMPTPPMVESSTRDAEAEPGVAGVDQGTWFKKQGASSENQGASLEKMIVPDAANMPPTPWQTEIFAPGTCAGAMPRICRTLSCSAYMPYMPECM